MDPVILEKPISQGKPLTADEVTKASTPVKRPIVEKLKRALPVLGVGLVLGYLFGRRKK